ncbi:MAG TPA: hypothetical protein VM866_07825, partial [Pyrinomonadaceae bacterium]|nr:hypothetical protein [Pyrinomonadaceae bacterium]
MPEENLLTTLEGSLRQTRATRSRLSSRLADLEAEAERLRTELAEMDGLASQTEAAMFRILSSMLGTGAATTTPSDAEIEAALMRDAAKAQQSASVRVESVTAAAHARHEMPPVRADIEPKDERFLDRTIPQATALLLREAGSPLHVNEIYNRLLEGSFQFTGQHPTISIAVSLNRNG